METRRLELPSALAGTVDWDSVRSILENLTEFCLNEDNRSRVSAENLKKLDNLLQMLVDEGVPRSDVFAHAFRFLRNSVASCHANQERVREETNLFKVSSAFLQLQLKQLDSKRSKEGSTTMGTSLSDNDVVALRCALQFLANSMTENPRNCECVLKTFQTDINSLLKSLPDDEKIVQFIAMIIHLGLKQPDPDHLVDPQVFDTLLANLHQEFVIYAVESLVGCNTFFEIVYDQMEPRSRIKLISFLNERSDLYQQLSESVIVKLKTNFVERSDFILRAKIGDRDDVFCWEIAVLLEFLCSISANSTQDCLKLDSVLLTTVLYLLRQIHATGKNTGDSDNVFSIEEDLHKLTSKSLSATELEDIRAHPTFQFKAHLIRLIANLVHRNQTNQDKVRELECLPIILDNCKLDARNPFIAQWSVLAIRNLCEGNELNQAFIREIQRVDTENMLPNLELINLDGE